MPDLGQHCLHMYNKKEARPMHYTGKNVMDNLIIIFLSLSVTSHINCIVARCLINVVYLLHVPLSGHDNVHFFNYVANDDLSTQRSKITS